MDKNILRIKEVVEKLRKEESGLIIDEEKESYKYFRSSVLIEQDGENVRIPISGIKQLARIRSLTVEDLQTIFDVKIDQAAVESFHKGKIQDKKDAEKKLEAWIKKQVTTKKQEKLSENQVRLLLHLLGTLTLKEKEFKDSETKLAFNLVLCQHKRPDGNPLFHFCLLKDGENLEGISFKQPLMAHSIGILFGFLILGIAPNLPLWLDMFLPAPIVRFAYDLALAYVVAMVFIVIMAFLPIGREIDTIQAIKLAPIYFPQFKTGEVYFTFPSGSKTPVGEYLDFGNLFSGIFEAGLVNHEITARYHYADEKEKNTELSQQLALTKTGRLAQESIKEKNRARKLATQRYSKGWNFSLWKVAGALVALIVIYLLYLILNTLMRLDLGQPTAQGVLLLVFTQFQTFWGFLLVSLFQ